MKLSASLIFEQLSGQAELISAGARFDELCLGRPTFYSGGNVSPGELLIDADGLLTGVSLLPEGCCIIVSDAPDGFLPASASVLCVKGTGREELLNELQRIYDIYDEWDERLHRCISSHRDMQSIIDLSSPIFENPLCFTDAAFRYTAMSDCARHGGDAADIVPQNPDEVFLCEHPEMLTDRGDLAVFRSASKNKKLLCAELRSHQQFVVGIILIENRTSLRRSDAALLAHMADYVLMLFEYTSAMRRGSTLSLVTVFVSLLEMQPVSLSELSSALSVFDWRIGDPYEVFYLKLPSPEYDYSYLTNRGREFEKLLSSSLAVAYGGDIVMIHNLSGAKEVEPTAKLHAFLRDNRLGCGRSRVFRDISELHAHYAQAVYALTCGARRYPEKLFHRFSDYCLDFMSENCLGDQKAESLLPSGLSELSEHDRRHGTQYLATLRAFCDMKYNATHTADALHIHRTTFLDRLKRIQEILDVDFDSPDERLHLLLALRLLDSK